MNNNRGASLSDFVNHFISAGRGYSLKLEEITVTGRQSFESGSWLSRAEHRVSDAVDKMENIKSVTTANFGFKNSKEALDIGGDIGSI